MQKKIPNILQELYKVVMFFHLNSLNFKQTNKGYSQTITDSSLKEEIRGVVHKNKSCIPRRKFIITFKSSFILQKAFINHILNFLFQNNTDKKGITASYYLLKGYGYFFFCFTTK